VAAHLNCRLHNVGLTLTSSNAAVVEVAHDYLAAWTDDDAVAAQIDVRLTWGRELPPASALARLGRRLWLGEGRLRFSEIRLLPGLQMDVTWENDHLRIEAAYAWPDRRTRWLSKLVQPLRRRTYLSLIYYLLYFPLGWWLERERGWSLIHAAGLAHGADGVVVAGLPGCGKSTFVWAALARPNWRILSDNLLFTDGDAIYACPEPLHVDAHAQALGEVPAESVTTTGRAYSHRREEFQIAAHRRAERATATRVLFLRRGPRHERRALSPAVALRRLWANDVLAQEWRAYQTGAAALHHLTPEIGNAERRWANLERLSRLPCEEIVAAEDAPLPSALYETLEKKEVAVA
jgi:hypothetical protein